MKATGISSSALSLMGALAIPANAQQGAPATVVLPTDRTVLPIPEPQYPHSTVFDARNAVRRRRASRSRRRPARPTCSSC